ncbi:hypothetical protein ACFQZZ_33350 [Nocardia sp. GCM10030253]|uniref:hypothetical protein n=1 Tax=Nocardia sp. GCM10030253 TaxID=3273404 RepID=UPI00362898CA
MTNTYSRGRCAGCWQPVDSGGRGWRQRETALCPSCSTQHDRYPDGDTPIAAYLSDIAGLSEKDWLPDYAGTELEKVQTGSTTLPQRSPTELARFVAQFNNWRLYGDEVCTADGLRIADRLEDAADAMHSMDWFTPNYSGISWMKFTGGREPATCTYPSAFAIRRWIATHHQD